MRSRQTDEADDAHHRDRRRRQQADPKKRPAPQTGHVDAEAAGLILAQAQRVLVAEGHPEQFCLSAAVRAHFGEAVGRTGGRRVRLRRQAVVREPALAVLAEPARDVEGQHDAVAEAAVVGFPHDIKGQGIYAYVTLNKGVEATEDLRKALISQVREEIGPIAAPDVIQWAPGLPKTRSGKIMRRILRKIAENELGALGDTSTLADPSVVDDLVKNRAA